jgi:hypothetical protein
MKQALLAATFLVSAVSVMPASAAVTATFCGPQSEGNAPAGCSGSNESMVFLDAAKDVTVGFGQVGGNKNTFPTMQITSDGGALNMTIDLSNGFGTITPAHGFSTFNGLDITIPGFTFTDILFDAQLTPVRGQSTDSFTLSAFSGAHVLDGSNIEVDAADTDKQFAAFAVGGAFDEIDFRSATGFDEIKHIEISGLAPVAGSVPEPRTWAMMGVGFGLVGLMGWKRSRRDRLMPSLG